MQLHSELNMPIIIVAVNMRLTAAPGSNACKHSAIHGGCIAKQVRTKTALACNKNCIMLMTAKVGGLGFDSQWLPMHFFFDMFLS